MIFEPLSISGAYLIRKNIPIDERGYFSRIFDKAEFSHAGVNADFVQISLSRNYTKGTLRGLHSQTGESAEEKLVVCAQGEIFDVCVDMREDSPTYLQYCSAILSEENGQALYVPKGCAHGFISLTDNVQLVYFMTAEHNPQLERGYRWDDPALSIKWPVSPQIISEKDRNWSLIENR
ncbi:dTDP-4-dehydrorhamnose 3,5-epimerase [Desulfosporosinus sp. FKA]|uniref:dTDP-4-dehydrorhamnose 3,5-epimerase n=1 Tax=Desulfosporosinus sp. FKA TaxID=1969834 RepID=UPI000B4A2431|nr:dTDP-4-dehydrorhamnose 3,5-epimerase [Desulfosporosinus sp. FKA]